MGWKLYVLATYIIINVLLSAYDHYLRCNHSHIRELCAGFKEGRIAGPLCYDLCQGGEVIFNKCLTADPNKKVYRGTLRGTDVMLKFVTQWFREIDVKNSFLAKDHILSEQYEDLILNVVRSKFGDDCTQCKEVTETFTSMADVDQDGQLTWTELASFLSLVEQQEPAMLIALNGTKHSLDFLGYCGGLYAVEQVPFIAADFFGESWSLKDLTLLPLLCEPLDEVLRENALKVVHYFHSILPLYITDILNHFMLSLKQIVYGTFIQIRMPPLEEAFVFLSELMDLVLDLSSKPFGILQSCDAHIGNFGVTKNLTVKAIDLDLTFTKSSLGRILSETSCLSHEDCKVGAYDECRSPCDFDTGFCSPHTYYQDLQYICDTIFGTAFDFLHHNDSMSSQTLGCIKSGMSRVTILCLGLPHANSTELLSAQVKTVKLALKKVKKKCLNNAQL